MRPPNQVCPLPVLVGPRDAPALPAARTDLSEAAMRKLFEAVEGLKVRRGYADFFPPSQAPSAVLPPRDRSARASVGG